jgi:hypothetical protein
MYGRDKTQATHRKECSDSDEYLKGRVIPNAMDWAAATM